MPPSDDELYGDADFVPALTATGTIAGSVTIVLLCLNWTGNSLGLTTIGNL